jgi:phosphate starvation-inducible membrane PsiE
MPSEPAHENHEKEPALVHLLERGDGWAHVLVSVLLLLLALGILAMATVSFITDLSKGLAGAAFMDRGLTYLSDLLFGVIVLELLSTILTYIKARNLEATIKEFLIVGLISSIRKILLVGAQSSLDKGTGDDFQKEAIGTVISIVGILLLIAGLLLLDMRKKRKVVDLDLE